MTSPLDRVLRPRSIAVVGATADRTKFGGKVLEFLVTHRYPGRVVPINPKHEELFGTRCYPSVSAVPVDAPVDVALVAVPRDHVAGVLRECAAKGAAAAVVFTSGFSEADARGRELEAELAAVHRETGLRIIGPNAYGFINFVDRVPATPAITLRQGSLVAGAVGLVSHSGGMATGSIYARARRHGVFFSQIICPGNEVDLDLCDFLEFLVDDEATRVIAAVIEGLHDGRRFLDALAAARDRGKPVVALKIGRSQLGRELALSHTAHLSGSDEIFQAVCAEHGVIRVDDYDELYLTAGLLASIDEARRQRLARRAHLALISISGGIASVAGDLAGMHGLAMAPLAPASRDALAPLLPDFQAPANPLDVGAVALTRPDVVAQAIDILGADPGVDVVIPALTVAEDYDPVLEAIVSRADGEKPLVALWAGVASGGRGAEILHAARVPYFDAPRDLMTALERLVGHCRAWRHDAEDDRAARDVSASIEGRDLALNASLKQARSERRSVLSEWESKRFLAELGFAVPRGEFVDTVRNAVAAADRLGYPVVLKAVSPFVAHKSEHGLVALNLDSPDAVVAAFRHLEAKRAAPGSVADGFLVEEMVQAQVEAVVGMKVDPQFGPVIMVGSGGILVELMKDVTVLVPPVAPSHVRRALDRLPALRILLDGYRGSRAADREALVALLVHFGAAAAALSAVATEVEMNPVLIKAGGGGVVAADALVRLRG